MTGKKMLKGILTVSVLFGIVLFATNVEAKKEPTREEIQKCATEKVLKAAEKSEYKDPQEAIMDCTEELSR